MEPTHETHAPGSTELDNSHYESSLLVLPVQPCPEAHDRRTVVHGTLWQTRGPTCAQPLVRTGGAGLTPRVLACCHGGGLGAVVGDLDDAVLISTDSLRRSLPREGLRPNSGG